MKKYLLLYPIEYFWISAKGWLFSGADLAALTISFLKNVSFYQYVFAVSCIFSGIMALMPWMHYQVDFLGIEDVYIGSNSKFIFTMIAPVGMLLLVIPTSRKKIIFYIFFAAIALTYVSGFYWINPVHTKMINPMDYEILKPLYYYGIGLSLSGIFAFEALKRSAINYSWLFEPLSAGKDALKKPDKEKTAALKKNLKVKQKEKTKIPAALPENKNTAMPADVKKSKETLFNNIFRKKEKKKTIAKPSGKKNLNIKIAR